MAAALAAAAGGPSGCHSNMERQLAEVEALHAIYWGDGEFRMTQDEKAALEMLSRQDLDASFSGILALSFTVQLPSVELGGWPVKVGFSLPANYPDRQALRVSVECGGSTRRQHHEVINRAARQTAESLVGNESILQVLQMVEGEGNNVTIYVRRLQNLRWQALNVRGEEQEEATAGQDTDDLRRFPVGIQELNENAMSELGALCRKAGLEPLFLSGLKILQ